MKVLYLGAQPDSVARMGKRMVGKTYRAKPKQQQEQTVQVNPEPPSEEPQEQSRARVRGKLLSLGLAALGIVYGDIGTSPLYALHESFFGLDRLAVSPVNVLGVLSLIFWSLTLIISVKYLLVVMRADNHGEGGILTLMALLSPWRGNASRRRAILIVLGVFGAALLCGDGMITPAISVLSAVQGLQVAAPQLRFYVIPTTIIVLMVLFIIQRRGSGSVGAIFGPVMLLRFLILAALGLYGIDLNPKVLRALDPAHAFRFFITNHFSGLLAMGGLFLVVTGGEALYADMGHFGRQPIRLMWFCVVLPALVLNYFGQGAIVMSHPALLDHLPFYQLAPQWARYPLIALATVATVIASQAAISGVFSLTRQAIQLGQCPRMRIIQTSPEESGQIYVPSLNKVLMIAAIGLVIGFRTSNHLASAYGVAVSTTMLITTVLLYFIMRERWRWPMQPALFVAGIFLTADASFFLGNLFKIPDGGWSPLVVGILIYTYMSTWRRGRELVLARVRRSTESLSSLLARLKSDPPIRVKGTAVFLTPPTQGSPPMLYHHLKHNQILHNQVVLLTVRTESMPRVPASQRLRLEPLGLDFYRITVSYGFMQNPNVPVALRLCERFGLKIELENTTYYIGREHLLPSNTRPGMPLWREKLFAFMSRNAAGTMLFYKLPAERVVELGLQVRL